MSPPHPASQASLGHSEGAHFSFFFFKPWNLNDYIHISQTYLPILQNKEPGKFKACIELNKSIELNESVAQIEISAGKSSVVSSSLGFAGIERDQCLGPFQPR